MIGRKFQASADGLGVQEAVDQDQFFQVMDRRRLPSGPDEIKGTQI